MFAIAVLQSIFEIAVVDAFIVGQFSLSIEGVIMKGTFVGGIRVFEESFDFLIVFEDALKERGTGLLDPFAMFLVVLEVPSVRDMLVLVHPYPVGPSMFDLSFIVVPIGIDKPPKPMRHTLNKSPLIVALIRIIILPKAMGDFVLPVPMIDHTRSLKLIVIGLILAFIIILRHLQRICNHYGFTYARDCRRDFGVQNGHCHFLAFEYVFQLVRL